MTELPQGPPDWFESLYKKLLISDLSAQLPGALTDDTAKIRARIEELRASVLRLLQSNTLPPESVARDKESLRLMEVTLATMDQRMSVAPANATTITEDEIRKLLGWASVLSLSEHQPDQAIAYEVATRLIELSDKPDPGLVSAADLILSRIGNFPGRKLLRRRCAGGDDNTPEAPARLGLERIGRELENTVEIAGMAQPPLTDFQYEFLESLDSAPSVSVSAPTSAGKSFILGLDLIRRLRKVVPACVVYVVPTRALIREVTIEIRKRLRQAGMDGIPVRSVPFPITQAKAPQGAVFVLTQERLLSLLHSRDGKQWITTLVVDEAQSIRDEARGVILQTAIEAVRIKHPQAEVHFASPLASNPDFLLDVVQRRDTGKHLVRTLSPVSQNLILVSPVKNKPALVDYQLVSSDQPLALGRRSLSFKMNVGVYKSRALFAKEVTKPDEITLIYANTPGNTEELASALIEGLDPPGTPDPDIRELIEFIRADIHAEYPLIQCLPHGVAYHYGYMPAIVRARVEDLCRDGKLKYVCCTSTLLQGVNLPARHIIIENPKRGRDDMTRADFLNLAGRAGRLLREFHGNVWCLRPADWEEKSYEGPQLTEIRSAMNEAMADGGTIVQRVLNNEASAKELDFGEATLTKVFCEYTNRQLDLSASPWKTEANATALSVTAQQVGALRVTLPAEVLDANRSVRPDRLQTLFDHLNAQPNLSGFVPLAPYAQDPQNRMRMILQLVYEKLGGVQNDSYKYYEQLARKWTYGEPMAQIIAQHIGYLRSRKTTQAVSTIIRELLSDLEQEVRFRLVKYYMAYNSVLGLVLRERGDTAIADALEPFHVYLECGASDRIALNLIALGLSRATALALRDKVQFPDEASPEDCLAKLATLDLATLAIPALCLREVKDLFGRQ